MANNLDAFVPEIWSRNVIQNIDQVNVAMAVCANTDYEGEIADFGDTVQVRTYGNVTVKDYQRGMLTDAEDLVPVKETMTIDTAKYFQFDVDDLDQAQNDLSAIQGYTMRAGVSTSNYLDAYIFSLHASALTANKISNGGSAINIDSNGAGTAIYDLVVQAGEKLDDQDVPSDARWIVISPYAKKLALLSTTYLVRATDLGDSIVQTGKIGMTARQAMQRGYLGQMGAFDVWVSTKLPTNGANKYWVYGQGKPISFAAQIKPGSVEAIRLESSFATRVRGLILYGGKVFAETSKALGSVYVDNS